MIPITASVIISIGTTINKVLTLLMIITVRISSSDYTPVCVSAQIKKALCFPCASAYLIRKTVIPDCLAVLLFFFHLTDLFPDISLFRIIPAVFQQMLPVLQPQLFLSFLHRRADSLTLPVAPAVFQSDVSLAFLRWRGIIIFLPVWIYQKQPHRLIPFLLGYARINVSRLSILFQNLLFQFFGIIRLGLFSCGPKACFLVMVLAPSKCHFCVNSHYHYLLLI